MLSHEERWRQMRRQGAECEMNGVRRDGDKVSPQLLLLSKAIKVT